MVWSSWLTGNSCLQEDRHRGLQDCQETVHDPELLQLGSQEEVVLYQEEHAGPGGPRWASQDCDSRKQLLSDLPSKDRLEYKGIKKKILKVPVQRLVLILPVEERDSKNDTKSFPGGQAGTAPHEEVVGDLSDTEQLAQLEWRIWLEKQS